jgi:hypothetical protein
MLLGEALGLLAPEYQPAGNPSPHNRAPLRLAREASTKISPKLSGQFHLDCSAQPPLVTIPPHRLPH